MPPIEAFSERYRSGWGQTRPPEDDTYVLLH